jgi:predicted nuclease with TOPRIM domain
MIARFDSMSIKDYKLSHDAALKRMEMAREMAEMESGKLKEELKEMDTETRRVREEGRKLKKEVEDGKDRERKMTKRLEMLMVSFSLHKVVCLDCRNETN